MLGLLSSCLSVRSDGPELCVGAAHLGAESSHSSHRCVQADLNDDIPLTYDRFLAFYSRCSVTTMDFNKILQLVSKSRVLEVFGVIAASRSDHDRGNAGPCAGDVSIKRNDRIPRVSRKFRESF